MKMNRRGDIGFPEAMMAVMVACIVLAAYVGAVALAPDDADDRPSFDRGLTDSVRMENGVIAWNPEDQLQGMIEREGYRGVTVTCCVPGSTDTRGFSAGSTDGSSTYERFMRSVPSDDGQVIPVVFKVIICT